jgi:adenylate cyclase class 2
MPIELEKKYRLRADDIADLTALLKEFGAEFIGEDLEENIIYSSDSLASAGAVVRIRRVGEQTTLTYKRRLGDNSDMKQQMEEETGVTDAESIMKIVAALGLEPRLVYEKIRRKWRFRNVEVVIDRLPFGDYMEIEGPAMAIREAEMLLGADELEPEPETYPRLTSRLGKKKDGVVESRF